MAELAYIGIGSNVGDRSGYLAGGVSALCARPGIELVALSSLYETDPVGYVDQPRFLNAAFAVHTQLPPHELLGAMRRVESGFGRQRSIHWGPRTLDLDLLAYGDQRIEDADLVLPHPRMWERAFVLTPLAEIAPTLRSPTTGDPIGVAAGQMADRGGVRRVGPFPPLPVDRSPGNQESPCPASP